MPLSWPVLLSAFGCDRTDRQGDALAPRSPIVMGMIGGCMLKFGTQIITGVNGLPVVCGLAVLAFLLVPRVIKGFPGVLAALIVGVIAAIATNSFAGEAGELAYIPPQLVIPKFNPNLVLSCSLPLAALVVGAENAQPWAS